MIRSFSGMTEVDNGGDLWRTLSKEEDLLQGVLLQLDPVSLVNLEMVCVNFREFMQRTQTWKKKFELSDQTLKNHVKDASESDHIQYKRRCLKLMNLEVNLKQGHCGKTKTELPKVFGNYNSGLFNHSLKAMHPDLVFVEGILRDLENSLVFDVREGRRKTLNPPPFPGLDCRVRSVDVSSDQVCLLRTPSPEHPEETFCILETYSVNAFNDNEFSLSSQSDPLERDEFGVGIKAKLAEEERILVLSFNMFGNAPIDMHGRVNIFEIDANHPTSPHPQKLVITRRIKCFSDDLFSKLSVFDANHLVGCAGPEDQVEIWNLNVEVGRGAEKVWTKRVVTEVSIPAVRISALESRPPFLFVGKSNARVEVWHTERDELLQTLGHGLETGLKMDLVKISVQDNNVFCLTEAGWIFCWDWELCTTRKSKDSTETGKRKKKKKRSDEAAPNWVKKAKPGMPILTFVSSSTSILSLEGGVGRRYMYLVERDFLNHVEKEKSQDSCQIEKRSVEQSQKKSKLPRLDEFPSIDLDERPRDEEDIIVLDETNVDSEDVIFLGDGNVLVLN